MAEDLGPDKGNDGYKPNYGPAAEMSNRAFQAQAAQRAEENLRQLNAPRRAQILENKPAEAKGSNALNPSAVKEKELTDPKGRLNRTKATDDEFNKIAQNYGKTTAHPLGKEETGPSLYKGTHRPSKDTLLHGIGGKKGNFFSRHKMGVIFVGGGLAGFLGLVVIVVILIVLLAPYKDVHFATVLRSIGMARFTYVMNKQFSRTIFDSAVLTKNSTGRFTPPEKSLFWKMVGINPRKQLYQLGHQNKLRFDFTGTPVWGGVLGTKNTFQGVTVDGKPIYLDDVAQELYSRPYDKLSRGEARKVRSRFADQVRTDLSKSLALESRRFRWGVYSGFYQATGIKLFKWKNKAAEFKGKTDAEARALNLEETVERVNGGEPGIKKSGVDAVDEEAEARRKAVIEAARNNTQPGEVRSKLADSVRGVRGLSTGVMVATIACVVHSLANSMQDAEVDREQRVARTNNDTQSASDQTKYGDTQQQAVGAENRTWDGAERSALYREFAGQPMTKADQEEINNVPGVLPTANRFASIIKTIDEIVFGTSIVSLVGGKAIQDAGCNILLNQWVQYGIAAVEGLVVVITAGQAGGVLAGLQAALRTALEFGASVGIGELIGLLIDNAIKSVANTDFSGLSTGADKFDENYVASDYSQQVGNRQITFGAPMSTEDTNAAQLQAVADLRDYYSQQPFKTRYFAIDNPFSLSGYLVARMPSSVGGLADSLQSGFTSLASIIGSPQRLVGSIANIFTAHNSVSAATQITRPDMFGVDEWGWTPSELQRVENDPAFEVANPEGNDLIHSVEPQLDALNQKYGPCYASGYILQHGKPDQCTKDFLTTTEALKWRTYMAYTYNAARLTGII